MAINYKNFIHPADKDALESLESIPILPKLMKKYINLVSERKYKLEHTSSFVRLGPNQLPKYYNMLVEICQKLEMPVPELYLSGNLDINAYAIGETDTFIVINAGSIEALPDNQIYAMLAHECGHILCHHTLYHMMGSWFVSGAQAFSFDFITAAASEALRLAFMYWNRCSEFSADRVAAYCCGSPDSTSDLMMSFAGGPSKLLPEIQFNKQAFMEQAKDYIDMVDKSFYNKMLEFWNFKENTHPLLAYRAFEIHQFYDKYGDTFDPHKPDEIECDVIELEEAPQDTEVKYMVKIYYEFIPPKNIFKLGGLLDNMPLDIEINGKTTRIQKGSNSTVELAAGEHTAIAKNSHKKCSFKINVSADMNLTVCWSADDEKFSLKKK